MTRSAEKARPSAGVFLFTAGPVLRRLWAGALDLLYPPRCAGCGRVDHALCPPCAEAVIRAEGQLMLPPITPLAGMAASAAHTGLMRQTVLTLKDSRPQPVVDALAVRLERTLTVCGWPVEVIVPVPLHATRLRERGHNQSELLASALARRTGLPCNPLALTRIRSTPHQVGQGAQARRQNVFGAFHGNNAQPDNHAVSLLIDDVTTTGATLQACAIALLEAGAAAVYSLTVTAASV